VKGVALTARKIGESAAAVNRKEKIADRAQNSLDGSALPLETLVCLIIVYILSSSSARAQMLPEVKSPEAGYRLAATIPGARLSDQHRYFRSFDGTCLFYRYWPGPGTSPNKPVVLVLHGIGYYSAPYKVIADALNPHGIDVYAVDARGHGLSCGRRGFVGTPAEAREDVASIVQLLKARRPAAKLFLLGESMGGAFALNYAKENNDQIAGLILLAPALGVPKGQFLRLSNLCLLPYYLFWQRTPAVSLIDKRLEESSRDAHFIAERRTDPLALQKVSFGYLKDIARLVENWKTEIAPRVHAPTLIIQGAEDRVVSKEDCLTLSKVLTSPDKRLKVYPNVRHTVLWDPETPAILEMVGKWVQNH